MPISIITYLSRYMKIACKNLPCMNANLFLAFVLFSCLLVRASFYSIKILSKSGLPINVLVLSSCDSPYLANCFAFKGFDFSKALDKAHANLTSDVDNLMPYNFNGIL